MARSDWLRKRSKWETAYYGSLIGAKCTGVKLRPAEFDESWPVLTFEHPDHGTLEVEVSRDEEGNGPGFLFGLIRPE